jgi:apolipoprotein N-acyltransferase
MPVRVPREFTDFNRLWNKFFPDAPQFPKQIIGLDIVDISDQEDFKYYNAAGFIDSGKIAKVYDKIKLAPFGEYLPWSDLMQTIGLTTLVPSTVGTFQRGTEYTVYDFGFAKACILICYDGTFSDNVRGFIQNGANLIVSITNDAWFGNSSAAFQHTSFYNFRAVETGRTIVRAANTGISGVLLPDGTMPVSTPLFTEVLLTETVPIYEITTPYLRWGDFFIWILAAGSFAWLAVLFARGRRS